MTATGCVLLPPAPNDLSCLVNQWQAWRGLNGPEGKAGPQESCLECRQGRKVMKAATKDSREWEPRPAELTWGRYAQEVGGGGKQGSGVRGQGSEVRGQGSGVRAKGLAT